MKKYPYIGLKQLHYFISVAENLCFTKAAKEHFISQTAMSQNILTLEKELGFTLFERTKRKVSLTDSGMSFYLDAKKLMDDFETAVKKAENIEHGYEGSIHIGFQGVHESNLLPKIIKIYKERYPQIMIELTQKPLNQLGRMLEKGTMDCIFSLTSDTRTSSNVSEFVYSREPLCAVLPFDHPLARQKKLRRSMFASDPVVFVKSENSAGTYERMLQDCMNAGFIPNIVTTTESVESTLMLIEAGIGVSFFPRSCQNSNHNLVFIELEHDGCVDLSIRWLKETDNSAVELFINTLREFRY